MAYKYTNFVLTPYSGSYAGQQISICKQSNVDPRAVMIDIDWSKYTSGYVACNLLGTTPSFPIDVIKSVYIDNLGMTEPVTIFFPDTQSELTCAANATLAQPVLTNQLAFNVILGQAGLNLFTTNQTVTTRIYVSNVDLSALINSQTPSAIAYYQISNIPGQGPEFLAKPSGEQRALWQLDLNTYDVIDLLNPQGTNPVTNDLFTNYGFMTQNSLARVYITDIKAYTEGVYLSGNPLNTMLESHVYFGPSNGAGVNILYWYFQIGMTLKDFEFRSLQESHNLFTQIKPFRTSYTLGISPARGTTTPLPPGAVVTGKFYLDIQFTYIALF